MTTSSTGLKYIKKSSETLFDVAQSVVDTLSRNSETVGVAESLTGGSVMAALASVPGASKAFRGGVVSYAAPIKQLLLDVDKELIEEKGTVVAEVAEQMAEGARGATNIKSDQTTWGISTTGVAGPDEHEGKPAGTVYIGIAGPEGVKAWGPFKFPGTPVHVREATVVEALARLREAMNERHGGEDRRREDREDREKERNGEINEREYTDWDEDGAEKNEKKDKETEETE